MTALNSLGSNVNSLRQLSWETAAFEKDVKEKVNWLGSKFSSLRVPPIVRDLLGAMKAFAVENPVTAVFILAVFVASALPISIFLGFAIATVLVSFLGFLFVEGTLLTVASVTFGGVVLVVGLVTLFFALMGGAGYFTTSKIYSVITGKDLKDLFRFLPLIGTFFDKEEEDKMLSPTPNGSAFKSSNGYCPSTKILPYSDEEEEEEEEDEEDEGNVEVLDSENETDNEEEETKSVTHSTSDSDAGIADTSIENMEQDYTPSDHPENDEKLKMSPKAPPPPPAHPVNGHEEEETQ